MADSHANLEAPFLLLAAVRSPLIPFVPSFCLKIHQPALVDGRTDAADTQRMSVRVRHCVECPSYHICYLIAFSPYSNRAYLMRAGFFKACEVSKYARDRGLHTRRSLTYSPAAAAWAMVRH
jgi:hypothetical protein